MWTQIVGKIRVAHAPVINHWRHATLYVSPRGLTTSTIPYRDHAFEIESDFVDHQLHICTTRMTVGAWRSRQSRSAANGPWCRTPSMSSALSAMLAAESWVWSAI